MSARGWLDHSSSQHPHGRAGLACLHDPGHGLQYLAHHTLLFAPPAVGVAALVPAQTVHQQRQPPWRDRVRAHESHHHRRREATGCACRSEVSKSCQASLMAVLSGAGLPLPP